ncbi:hypothetical protein CJ030_MR2G020364 [Morella rubra]|nr:hypothetical protein CJ030_MR2G020364 [Morella rubra]
MRYVWMPRLMERIRAAAESHSGPPTSAYNTDQFPNNHTGVNPSQAQASGSDHPVDQPHIMPGISGASSDSSDAQVSSISDLTEYNDLSGGGNYLDNSQNGSGLCKQAVMDIQGFEHSNGWFGGGDTLDSLWNDESTVWFLQQQLCDEA